MVENARRIGFSFSATKTTLVHFCQERGKRSNVMINLIDVWLKYKTTTKFLDLSFDRHSTWNSHMDDLAVSCKSVLNAITCMLHKTWGAERKIVLHLCVYYTVLSVDLLSKRHYSCALYSSSKRLCLKS